MSHRAVAYSPDGTRLAVASSVGIWLYDADTGAEVALLSRHTGDVFSVSFSPDGSTLAGGCQDGTIGLWDVAIGQEKARLKGHTGYVPSVSFSPDGNTLASLGGPSDHTIRLWDVVSGREKAILEEYIYGVVIRDVLTRWEYSCRCGFSRFGSFVGCSQRSAEALAARAYEECLVYVILAGWEYSRQWEF